MTQSYTVPWRPTAGRRLGAGNESRHVAEIAGVGDDARGLHIVLLSVRVDARRGDPTGEVPPHAF